MPGSDGVTAAKDELRWDPLLVVDDPYPTYRRLRDEAPLYHQQDRGIWAFSRFDDVQAAARDWQTFSSAKGNDHDDTYQLFLPAGDLAGLDPPDHDRVRSVLRLAFNPSAVRTRFEPPVRVAARRLIDRFADRGAADLARELARPLPAEMVCTWLGFPEVDHPQLLAWFAGMLERTPGLSALPEAALDARDRLRAYIEGAAEERRAHPTEDLLGVLVQARTDGAISADELLGCCVLLFVAGITTTSGLISNSLLHLDRFPDQRDLLRQKPERMAAAIEELGRFDAPIQTVRRTATRDVESFGMVIPKGAPVSLIWASANRDERRWPDPDRLDIDRAPERHVVFGEGIHHCIGAPLARLEARIALEEFFARVPTYAVSGPVRRVATTDRALESLPVEF
jgi:cytochrome P450